MSAFTVNADGNLQTVFESGSVMEYQFTSHFGDVPRERLWFRIDGGPFEIGHSKEVVTSHAATRGVMVRFLKGELSHEEYNELLPW